MSNKIHARFWKSQSPLSVDCVVQDPNNLGIKLISAMAEIASAKPCDVIVHHRKGDSRGHQVHVAATQEQWDAVREYLKADS